MADERELRDWMKRTANRDRAALRSLYEATQPAVHGLVRSILNGTDGVEDVLTDTYVRVWNHAHTYDAERGSVLLWISIIARRRAVDRLRWLGRDRVEATDPSDLFSLCGSEPTPLQATERAEEAGDVRDALSRLDDSQRTAIEAVFFRGLTHTQAAAALGAPLGTLKGRVRAALQNLRRQLGQLEEGAV